MKKKICPPHFFAETLLKSELIPPPHLFLSILHQENSPKPQHFQERATWSCDVINKQWLPSAQKANFIRSPCRLNFHITSAKRAELPILHKQRRCRLGLSHLQGQEARPRRDPSKTTHSSPPPRSIYFFVLHIQPTGLSYIMEQSGI